ncbi:MAG: cyclic nucleotide-binding domain-containing protein [bacterium]|nr:cyclic nucleotide-binding domain-containing protein [bacterium]
MLSWLKSGDQDVYALIARKNYPKAIKVLQRELKAGPGSVHLRQLLADVWVLAGERTQAIEILESLVDEFADDGFVTKAIAMLKKIQRIDPGRSENRRLAALLNADEPERDVPLVQAHLEDTQTSEIATVIDHPEVTSELRANWFDNAVGERRDFRWSAILEGFGKDDLAALIGGLRLLVKKPGAIIYGEDEPGNSMYILASGMARVYRRNPRGQYEQAGVLHEGQFFGEASVLIGSNRLSTITAAEECELLELDTETFERISKRSPQLREKIKHLYDRRASFETASLDY